MLSFKWFVVMAAVFFLSGCANATLVVHHQDPTAPIAKVYVDGQYQGQVIYGEKLEVDIEPGIRNILASTPRSKHNAWNPNKKAWHVIVEEQCTVTLFTPKARQNNGSK